MRACLRVRSGYDPSVVEAGWRTREWPRPARPGAPSFSLVLPPPNVTGSLHLGHALTAALQDGMVRRARQTGHDAVWVPGLDHAGIATQAVVERRLAPKTTRAELGREKFVEEVWRWKAEKEGEITGQLRRLGLALDWPRHAFTLDPGYARAVTELFCRLHERGLVYRAARAVSWCPRLQSVISDIEIDVQERDGMLHLVRYGPSITVATTRPETIYADVAVAVHPDDARYRGLTECVNPLTGRRLPVVRDATLVDMGVGTGAVKVTPAHSVEDRACGERLGLPLDERAFDEAGKMRADSHVAGQDRIACREQVLDVLRSKGALESSRVQPGMRVPVCSRSGDVLEPSWKPQWFVDCQVMSKRALGYAEAIIPEKHRGEWRRFLGESRDWCISRQLWWGHRVPAYLVDGEWVVARHPPPVFERQDEDVLDTWFSSALFPLASLGWPQALDRAHYPLTVMETGSDILFFWVARMAMICSEMEPELGCPFGRVMLHPMVRDKFGRKMSKSVGNVIDPLHLIEGQSLDDMVRQAELNTARLSATELQRSIGYLKKEFPNGLPKCGADSVRFTLVDCESSDSLNLDVENVAETTRMCNKIWNAAKFVQSRPKPTTMGELGPAERWIRAQMDHLSNQMIAGFAADKLYRCTKELRVFLLLFCNHYIEYAKLVSTDTANYFLQAAFDSFLMQLHPFMPFITEHLLQRDCVMGPLSDQTVAVDVELDIEPFAHVIAVVSAVRNAKTVRKGPFSVQVGRSGEPHVDAAVSEMLPLIRRMCKVEAISVGEGGNGSVVVARRNLSITIVGGEEEDAKDDGQTSNKLLKLQEKLAKIDSKWCEEKATPTARAFHHKNRDAIVGQIEKLQRNKKD